METLNYLSIATRNQVHICLEMLPLPMEFKMNKKKIDVVGIALCMLCFVISSCDVDPFGNSINEGVIEYDVSFPYLENSVLKNVFPEEMVFHFKDDQVHGELKSLGGIVSTEYIANGESQELVQMLKAFKDRYAMKLSSDQVGVMLTEMPAVTFEFTDETDSIAGYLCKKTIANFLTDSVPPIILYHTDQIEIENPNWFTHFREIKGVLLAYELEQYGMRMKLRARKVINQKVENDFFKVPEQYEMIKRSEMAQHVNDMISQFTVDQLP